MLLQIRVVLVLVWKTLAPHEHRVLQCVRQALRGRRVAERAHADSQRSRRLLLRRWRGSPVRLSAVLLVLLSCLVFLILLIVLVATRVFLVLLHLVTVVLRLARQEPQDAVSCETHRRCVCSHEGIVHKERHKTVLKLHPTIFALVLR